MLRSTSGGRLLAGHVGTLKFVSLQKRADHQLLDLVSFRLQYLMFGYMASKWSSEHHCPAEWLHLFYPFQTLHHHLLLRLVFTCSTIYWFCNDCRLYTLNIHIAYHIKSISFSSITFTTYSELRLIFQKLCLKNDPFSFC